jgi:hypothetical protein
MIMIVPTTGPRPGGPLSLADAPPDDLASEAGPLADAHAQAVLGEMAGMLRDSRPGALFCGAAIAAITIGTAVEAAALPLVSHNGPGMVIVGGLFAILTLCVLRTVTLLVVSGLPLEQALAQQRLAAGAPLDPRAPWATIPVPGAVSQPAAPTGGVWSWNRAYLLLSQARYRAERVQAALNWALITSGVFLASTAALIFIR